MKVKITFEADVTDFPAYDDPLDSECIANFRYLFYNSVLHTLDMRLLAYKADQSSIDEAYLKASKEDENLMKLLLNSMKVEKI